MRLCIILVLLPFFFSFLWCHSFKFLFFEHRALWVVFSTLNQTEHLLWGFSFCLPRPIFTYFGNRPVAFEVAWVLASLAQPNHIACLCSGVSFSCRLHESSIPLGIDASCVIPIPINIGPFLLVKISDNIVMNFSIRITGY